MAAQMVALLTLLEAGDVLGDSLFRQAVDDPSLRRFDETPGNYNTFWIADRSFDNRTSLIVDPANGRIPPLTEEAQAARAAGARPSRPSSPIPTTVIHLLLMRFPPPAH